MLIFAAIYALWRRLTGSKAAPSSRESRAPSNRAIVLFAVALGLVTFVVRVWVPVGYWFEPQHLQLAHFPQYIALFIIGIVASRGGWFDRLTRAQVRFWRWR